MHLISVHVPKCAGTSLLAALIAAYGKERIYLDYCDRLLDPESPINADRIGFIQEFKMRRDARLKGKFVAHGHICIEKYEGIDAPRFTMLREPLDRLISHYFFWKGLPARGHSLHDQFLADRPDIVAFARMPGLRHFYTQVLFRDTDMGVFDLIGSTERLGETMANLEGLIGRNLRLEKGNPNAFFGYSERRQEILEDAELLGELRDLLFDDIAFYQRHTTM